MNIAYLAPLDRAIDRMKRMLFRPFAFETWIVLGFAAFLSGLGESAGGGANVFRRSVTGSDAEFFRGGADRLLEILSNPVWVVLIVFVVCIVLALIVLLLWISSRGKFIFLDGVIHGRAAIVEPWKKFQRLGDSLFLWRLVFASITLFLVLCVMLPLVLALLHGAQGGWLAAGIVLTVFLAGLAAVLAIATLFVGMLLSHFVVPVMYRDGLTATAAWGRFLPLLGKEFGRFFLYALFLVAVSVAVAAAIVVAGCATLCCGFVLLAIPYVGSVVRLPVSVAYRAFGLEFLAQFGPEWSVFPAPAESLPAPPEPPPAPAPSDAGPAV